MLLFFCELWSISVNQRMKANHNCGGTVSTSYQVVVNISKSKNESKSQHAIVNKDSERCCGQYQ